MGTIIAGPILRTLVQVHDQPKGIFFIIIVNVLFRISMWLLSLSFFSTKAVYCNSGSDTKYDC